MLDEYFKKHLENKQDQEAFDFGLVGNEPTPPVGDPEKEVKNPSILNKNLEAFVQARTPIDTQESILSRTVIQGAPIENVITLMDKGAGRYKKAGESQGMWDRVGYVPGVDNQKLYDDNITTWQQWGRSAAGHVSLHKISIEDNFGYGAFDNTPDSHKDFVKAIERYGSMKGGNTAWWQDLFLQSGYTTGIIVDMAAEMAVMTGLTLASRGITAPATIPKMGATAVKGFFNIKKGWSTFQRINKIIHASRKVKDLNKLQKLGNFINPLDNTTKFVRSLGKASELRHVMKNMGAPEKIMRGVGALYRDTKMAHLVYTESTLEGNIIYDDKLERLIEGHKGVLSAQDLEKYKKESAQVSFASKVENALVIGATNKIFLRNIFRSYDGLLGVSRISSTGRFYQTTASRTGATSSRRGIIGFPKRVKQAWSNGFVPGLKSTLKGTLRSSQQYLAPNFAEGVQEFLQEAIHDQAMHMDGSAKHGDYWSDLLRAGQYGLDRQWGPRGLSVFLSGFMMGGLVSPVTHGIKGGTTFLQGGHEFITDHKQYKKTKEAERLQFEHDAKLITETISNIGEATTDKSFGFIKQSDLEEEINNAVIDEDKHEFKNAKDKSNREGLRAIMKHNMMGDLINTLESFKTMNAEEVVEAFPEITKHTSSQRISDMLDRRIEQAERFEKYYNEVQENVINPIDLKSLDPNDPNFAQLKLKHDMFEVAKEQLIFSKAEMGDNLGRKERMLKVVKEEFEAANIPFNDYEVLLSDASMQLEVDKLSIELANMDVVPETQTKKDKQIVKQKIKKLEAIIKFKQASLEVEDVSERIDDLNDIDPALIKKKQIKEIKKLEKLKVQANTRLYNRFNDYLKVITPNFSGPKFTNFSEKTFDIIYDYYRLSQRNNSLDWAVNVLTNPTMMDEHVGRMMEMNKIYMAQFQRYVENSLIKSKDKKLIQETMEKLISMDVGFRVVYMDKLITTGTYPPVLNSIKTGEVIPKKISKKNKRGGVVGEEDNPFYLEIKEVLDEMIESLHPQTTPVKKEDLKEEDETGSEEGDITSRKPAPVVKDEEEEDEEEDVFKDGDQIITETNFGQTETPLESYPKEVLKSLTATYKESVKAGDVADKTVDDLTTDNLTPQFRKWVDDAGGSDIIEEYNEKVVKNQGPLIKTTYELTTQKQKTELFGLEYETVEKVNEILDIKEVENIIQNQIKYSQRKKEPTKKEEDTSTEGKVDDKTGEPQEKQIKSIQEEIDNINYRIKTLNQFAANTDSHAAKERTKKQVKELDAKRKELEEKLEEEDTSAELEGYTQVATNVSVAGVSFKKDAIAKVKEGDILSVELEVAEEGKVIYAAGTRKTGYKYAINIKNSEGENIGTLPYDEKAAKAVMESSNPGATKIKIDKLSLQPDGVTSIKTTVYTIDDSQSDAGKQGEQMSLDFGTETSEDPFEAALKEKTTEQEKRIESLITEAKKLYQPAQPNNAPNFDLAKAVEDHIFSIKSLDKKFSTSGYTIDKEALEDVYNYVKKILDDAGNMENISNLFTENYKKTLERLDPKRIDERNQIKKEDKVLKELGYSRADIKKLRLEQPARITHILETKIEKGAEILKGKNKELTKKDLKLINSITIDNYNFRTEDEINALRADIKINNSDLYTALETEINNKLEELKNTISDLNDFSKLKETDMVIMTDGTVRKVEKLSKTKVILIQQGLLQSPLEVSKKDFADKVSLINNDFKADSKVIDSIIEKSNVDELKTMLEDYAGTAAKADNTDVKPEDLEDYFKKC